MCGIAGYFVPNGVEPPDRSALERALRTLGHRGPDASGVWIADDRRVGLAHARLVVIDPDGGAQPMVDPETGCVVAANGEIYNFEELKRGHAEHGRPSHTRSDTEALLLGFALEGPRVLNSLRGMFAFAAYDPRDGTLLLARDRHGQKPLYHAATPGGGLVFASEARALFALLAHAPEPDEEALSIYLSFGYVPAPRTAWRGVRKLPAAHFLLAGREEPDRYWRRPAPAKTAPRREEAAEELRERIRDAVHQRLVSDVPLGAFLSGGLDSATVVAFMAEASGEPVRTFTVKNPHPEYDESATARAVAERYGTRHTEITIDPPDVEEIPQILGRFGEPFGDSSALAGALVSRAAREHVTVALTGDGGDEAFGGYDRFRILSRIDRVPRLLGRLLRPVLRGRGRRVAELSGMEPWRRYYEFYESFNSGTRERLLTDRFREARGDAPADFLRRLYLSFPGGEPDRMLATDASTWLPDDLNPKVDITSMAVALECRSPLQDHLLVEACARVPAGRHLEGRGKALLRLAVADLLPPAVLAGKKRGFAAPVEHWFRGDLAGFLESKLTGKALASLDLVRPEAVGEVVAGLTKGTATGRPRIQVFILLALAIWAENNT